MKCGSFGNKLNIFLIFTSIVMIYITYQSVIYAHGQPMTNMNNTIEQHAEHTLDNLIISEHIPLTGQLLVEIIYFSWTSRLLLPA